MRALIVCAVTAALIVSALGAWYVWPSPYRYFEMDGLPVREHRVSGELELMGAAGWKPLTQVTAPFVAAEDAKAR